ncbi:MAG TPA: hypothetical protein IAD24_04530 [Candidatus Aphodomorpha intestinavium]|uniref:Tetratricopeptide repeat protein n=1 Tax=Candidatus Aphodomorpha intestinavium TaxID=2840672 RepID=A0A9D1STP8_9FIRM|nr:hypothetical protein [Candidatus Aphodomorpha intestinavium]
MRKKLVITRVGRQAPQSSQVWPEELPVPLAERAAQLYPLIASGTGTREEYLELAGELAKQMLYRQSAAALSAWLTGHPFDAECYCLRGRRYLAMMQYEQGAADLEMSARLDPDNWSTEYHRGLVHFIRGDFARASQAFLHCHALSADGGSLISAANWCYLSLMRQGRRAEAEALVGAIGEDIDYDENYSDYKSVMLFSGRMSVEETLKVDEDDLPDITLAVNAYAAANYYLARGEMEQARHYLDVTVQAAAPQMWSAFAYHAARADLKRLFQEGATC